MIKCQNGLKKCFKYFYLSYLKNKRFKNVTNKFKQQQIIEKDMIWLEFKKKLKKKKKRLASLMSK